MEESKLTGYQNKAIVDVLCEMARNGASTPTGSVLASPFEKTRKILEANFKELNKITDFSV